MPPLPVPDRSTDRARHGPHVLTPAYYERLYALEQEHGWFRGMRALAGALLARLLRRGPDWRVLDAGCGTGSMLDWLRSFPGISVVGVDLSSDALRFCRRRGHPALIRGSVLSLPFRDRSFDLVVCADVLQHLPSPPGDAPVLAEFHRLLRPGGYLYVRTNSSLGTGSRAGAQADSYRRYTRVELAERARAASFVIERATYANSLPSLLSLVLRHAGFDRRGQPRAQQRPGRPVDTHAHDTGLNVHLRPPGRRWIDQVLLLLLRLEAFYVRHLRGSLPYGGSLLLLARKPPVPSPPRSVRYFDAVADRYSARYLEDSQAGYAFRVRKARVLELLDGAQGVVLDVGCGPGVMAGAVLGLGCQFVGVDASPRMAAEGRKACGSSSRARFGVGDAVALPFPDRTFDVVMCIGVIDRVGQPETAIAELGRVLRPGGTLLLSFPNLLSPCALWRSHLFYPVVGRLKRGLALVLGRPPQPDLASAATLWTPSAATRAVERLVGEVQAVAYFNFGLLPAPLDELFPRLAARLARRLEPLRGSRLRWLGAGYVVKAVKAG